MNAALRLSTEVTEHATEHAIELPAEPLVYGLAGFGGLLVLLLVTYAFRSVGKRH